MSVLADWARFGFVTADDLSRSSVEDATNSGVPAGVDITGGVSGTAGFGTGSADGGVLEIGPAVSATTARVDGLGRCGLGAVCFGASTLRVDAAAARTGPSVGLAAVGTGSAAKLAGETGPSAARAESPSSGTGVNVLADWVRFRFAKAGDGGSGQPASIRLSSSSVEEATNSGVPAEVDVAGKSAGLLGAGAGGGTEEAGGVLGGVLAECAADRLATGAGLGGEVGVGVVADADATRPARMKLTSAPGLSGGASVRRTKVKMRKAWRISEEEKAKPIASSDTRRRSPEARLSGE
jgi:hypothetical protein